MIYLRPKRNAQWQLRNPCGYHIYEALIRTLVSSHTITLIHKLCQQVCTKYTKSIQMVYKVINSSLDITKNPTYIQILMISLSTRQGSHMQQALPMLKLHLLAKLTALATPY